MKYLMADVHGDFRAFKKALKQIHFNAGEDQLILIGDILDRNEQGIEILQYITPFLKDGSIILLKGNHELFCEMYLEGTLDERRWDIYGGRATIAAVKKMNQNEQKELLRFLKALPHYMTIQTEKYGEVVLTHTGIQADDYVWNEDGTINVIKSIQKAVEMDEFRYLISVDIHNIPVTDKKKLDHFIICGHVCTYRFNEDMSNRIYRTPYYIDIDTGCGHKEYGGVLACYCVETDEVIYV